VYVYIIGGTKENGCDSFQPVTPAEAVGKEMTLTVLGVPLPPSPLPQWTQSCSPSRGPIRPFSVKLIPKLINKLANCFGARPVGLGSERFEQVYRY